MYCRVKLKHFELTLAFYCRLPNFKSCNDDDDNNNNNDDSNNNNNNNNNNNFPMAWKYRVGIWQGKATSHGQVKRSSALIGNHLEMVSQ